MTAVDYIIGAAGVLGAIAALTIGVRRLRYRWLPSWRGAPAWLLEAVVLIALLLVIGLLLGSLGAITPAMVFAACVVTGLVATAIGRRSPAGSPSRAGRLRLSGPGRLECALGVAVVGAGAAQWASVTIAAFHHGMLNTDTLWYHGPLAARFVQEGSTTGLFLSNPGAVIPYYPANSEVLAALTVLPFGTDFLVPLMNLVAYALVLLSAHVVGRARGVGVVSLCAVGLLLMSPQIAASQPGSAANDIFGVALFLAAVALVVSSQQRRGVLAVAAVAAGMAAGTKPTLIAPAVALAVGVTIAAPGSSRKLTALTWSTALAVLGGYWFFRNLVRTGSPIPWTERIGPIELPFHGVEFPESLTASVAELAANPSFQAGLAPALDAAFGPAWFLLLFLAGAGTVGAIVSPGDRVRRMLGVVALASLVSYLFTPQSGAFFLFNLRHASPALALGLVLLPTVPLVGARSARFSLLLALAALAAITLVAGGAWAAPHVLHGVLMAVVAAGAITAGALVVRSRLPRKVLLPAGAVALVLAGAVGWYLQRAYSSVRYTLPPGPDEVHYAVAGPLSEVFAWAQRVEGPVGLVNFFVQYPLYGPALENRVQYIGDALPHGGLATIRHCRGWYRALRDGGYRYVVTAPEDFLALRFSARSDAPVEARWMRRLPGSTELFREPGPVSVFRLERPARPGLCEALGGRRASASARSGKAAKASAPER